MLRVGVGLFQTLKKRRQRQKRRTALLCQQLHTHVLWPYGVNKTWTTPCLEQKWSCDVSQGIVIPACPASLLCFAVKRPHGRRCRVLSRNAVRSFVFMKVWFPVVMLQPLPNYTRFFLWSWKSFCHEEYWHKPNCNEKPLKQQGCEPETTKFCAVHSLMVRK